MYLPGGDRHLVVTPQLALRVALLGGVALLLFAIVFFRLWYLQVLSGDRYLAEARDNRVREIKVEAPRGKIVDRNGTLLVDNRTALTVQVQPQRLPRDRVERSRLIRRLGGTLGLSPQSVRRKIRREVRELPYSPVTLKTDVGLRTVFYLQENQRRFRGVEVRRVFLRRYPLEAIGAHLFGTTGEVTKEQLEQSRYAGVALGDRVGQSGIEYAYDRYLRGRNGASRVQVDAVGRPKGELSVRTPTAGGQLRLSIDLAVQKAGQKALQGFGLPGAFVAMDPRTGEVLGLGSNPSFDPNVFAKGVRRSTYKRLTSAANGAPLANRAIQGLYPTGSTFKLITATGAIESGLITPSTVLFDGGSLTVGGLAFKNAGGTAHGALALPRALQVSSDVFFYRLGLMADQKGGNIIQKWARRLGIGRPTGIDLPGEVRGLVPSPAWRNRLFRNKLTERPWTPGDNINLAVGQGDLQANPLQLAVAYSAIANGGHVVTPHIGLRVEDSQGSVIQEIQPGSQRNLKISGQTRSAILSGLRAAANDPGGTSTAVFEGFPITVAGKTGTAERGAQGDQSWYAAVAPHGADPRIVVAVTVERGGFGAEAAAPAARRILAAHFGIKGKKAIGRAGSSPD
jgi:penicillin-binding protein 2